jgi:ubiquinone/menaquinone biosynthesis C-methylase UbiE
MPIIRVDNYVDAYRIRAHADDLHELAARPDKKHVTEFVNRRILEMIQPGPDELLVDIGCGDASLLRMSGSVHCVGIVASEDERERLQQAFPDLSIKAGLAQRLPLKTKCASKIVCNATLFYLPSESDVQKAIAEIARISRPGATVWIGEIPEIDEYQHHGVYRGNSMFEFVWHLFTKNGCRSFLGMIRKWIKAAFGQEQIVLNSAGMIFFSAEKLIGMAESCGLKLKSYFRHRELDQEGNIVESEFRYDFVFTA